MIFWIMGRNSLFVIDWSLGDLVLWMLKFDIILWHEILEDVWELRSHSVVKEEEGDEGTSPFE